MAWKCCTDQVWGKKKKKTFSKYQKTKTQKYPSPFVEFSINKHSFKSVLVSLHSKPKNRSHVLRPRSEGVKTVGRGLEGKKKAWAKKEAESGHEGVKDSPPVPQDSLILDSCLESSKRPGLPACVCSGNTPPAPAVTCDLMSPRPHGAGHLRATGSPAPRGSGLRTRRRAGQKKEQLHGHEGESG